MDETTYLRYGVTKYILRYGVNEVVSKVKGSCDGKGFFFDKGGETEKAFCILGLMSPLLRGSVRNVMSSLFSFFLSLTPQKWKKAENSNVRRHKREPRQNEKKKKKSLIASWMVKWYVIIHRL